MSVHGKATHLLHGGFNISNWMNSIEVSDTVDIQETSGFQQDAKTYITGIADSTVTFGGRFSGQLEGVEHIIRDEIEAEGAPILTVGFGKPLAIGDPAMFGTVLTTAFGTSSPVAGVVSITGGAQVTGGLVDGVHLIPDTQYTVTTTTATYTGLASSDGATAVLHMTDNTHDGTADVLLQHSSNGTVWVDLHSFDQVAAETVGSEIVQISGTVERYLRVVVTLGGTGGGVRPFVALGRN